MSEIVERGPTRFSTAVALGAAFVATGASAIVTPTALAAALPGATAIFLSLARGSRRLLSVGVMGLLLGSMIAGIAGGRPLPILVGVTAGVLCWDYGTTAISLGTQLGRRASTERLEHVHAALSLGVGVVTVVLSYGIYRSIGGPHPVAAVFFLLLAVVLLAGTLR